MGRSKAISLKLDSLTSIDDINPVIISSLFKKTKYFSKHPFSNILSKKVICFLFFEPSSRTFSSFNTAAKRLNAKTLEYQNPLQTSSAVKGETFEDSIKVFSNYADAIVIRHPEAGSAQKARLATNIPIVNAGDGAGEHPSQALMDLYTIYSKHKKTDGLRGLFVGDLKNGRTVHSLLKILSYFKNNEIYVLSIKGLELSDTEIKAFKDRGLKITQIFKESDIPKNLDFWYWTRIQTERLKNKKIKNTFILRNELIEKYAGENTLFMHPLPRVGEILEEVDSDPRAIYLTDQIKNGLFMRMSILSSLNFKNG